jgi:4'-phosphopantetheinyl transferase
MSTRAWIRIARVADVLADAPGVASDWLSASEAERLATLRVEARRMQFLAGHWLVRQQLQRALGEEAARWRLHERRSQPPAVHGHEDAWRVSISHAGEWIAAAVSDAPIGIDLEARPRAFPASVEALLLEPGEPSGGVDADALLQRWVAKEAWIKREAGSALPARLARMRLRDVGHDHADVKIEVNAGFHFALAAARGAAVERHCDEALVVGPGFTVEEGPDSDPTP